MIREQTLTKEDVFPLMIIAGAISNKNQALEFVESIIDDTQGRRFRNFLDKCIQYKGESDRKSAFPWPNVTSSTPCLSAYGCYLTSKSLGTSFLSIIDKIRALNPEDKNSLKFLMKSSILQLRNSELILPNFEEFHKFFWDKVVKKTNNPRAKASDLGFHIEIFQTQASDTYPLALTQSMIYFMPTAHKHDYDIRDHVGFQLMVCMAILSAQAIYRRNQVLIPWILRIYQHWPGLGKLLRPNVGEYLRLSSVYDWTRCPPVWVVDPWNRRPLGEEALYPSLDGTLDLYQGDFSAPEPLSKRSTDLLAECSRLVDMSLYVTTHFCNMEITELPAFDVRPDEQEAFTKPSRSSLCQAYPQPERIWMR